MTNCNKSSSSTVDDLGIIMSDSFRSIVIVVRCAVADSVEHGASQTVVQKFGSWSS